MFKTGCCGGSSKSVVEMEKHDKESPEKEKVLKKEEDDVTEFKLTYFNARIGGESARFIFHVAGVPFEDYRIAENEVPEFKEKAKWGKFPILEFDGNTIYSSTAISRYLAKRFDLIGKNDIEAAMCDEYVEVCQDLRVAWKDFFEETDETKKEELKNQFLTTVFPAVLSKLNESVEENAVNGGSWLVGDSCTWADLFVVNFLQVCEDTVDPILLNEYLGLIKLKDAVLSIPEIKKYIENRPETSH